MISINSGQASSAAISNADTAGTPATSSTTTRASSPPPHHSQCARFMALKLLSASSLSAQSRLSSANPAGAKVDPLRTKSHLKVALLPLPGRWPIPEGLKVILPLLILQTLLCPLGTVSGEGPYRGRDADALLDQAESTPAGAAQERSQGHGRGPYGGGIGTNGCIGASGPRVPASTAAA
jgi:hypothetical protein